MGCHFWIVSVMAGARPAAEAACEAGGREVAGGWQLGTSRQCEAGSRSVVGYVKLWTVI